MLKMVQIIFIFPVAFILFPHVIVASNAARTLTSVEVAEGPGAYIEVPDPPQPPSPPLPDPVLGQGPGSGQVQNPLIEQACEPTEYKQLCIDSLKAEAMSTNADIKSLAFISLNITKTEASKTAEWLYDQLDDPNLGPGIQQAYTDCAEQYSDAVANVEDSMLAFFANAYNDIEVWMSTTISSADVCEQALKDGNALATMKKNNEVLKQLCKNSLAILGKLMKG